MAQPYDFGGGEDLLNTVKIVQILKENVVIYHFYLSQKEKIGKFDYIKLTTLKFIKKYHKENENVNFRVRDVCRAYDYQLISTQIIKAPTNQ